MYARVEHDCGHSMSFTGISSVRHLRRLCEDMTVTPGKLDMRYLKERTKSLSEEEKIVTLMIDEVYTAQRVEYTSGSFIGLTESGNTAKTVLTFMVQSLFGKYKDVVCLIPVDKLDTKTLRTWFDIVMETINDMLLVIAISTDNHVCNRKLFMDLCNGELCHSIEHPHRPGKKLFLIFDFTHNFKNIFNHFVNKKQMHPPIKGNEDIFDGPCHAKFLHIKNLYALEEGKTLKVAHQLKKVSLDPSSIARTSPQHALSVFSESTVLGLKHFAADGHPEFKETSRYVEFILTIWNIMSVKSPSKALRKRNSFFTPLHMGEDHPGVNYLRRAIDIFKDWQKSGRAGLSNETFMACIQTMGAVLSLTEYLQANHNVQYLLSGKIMSDPIEARFGMYRQSNGGNFFMSVKQLLLAEKKIRCLSLLRQDKLSGVITSYEPGEEDASANREDFQWLADFMQTADTDDVDDTDASVVFYVSGYIGRSIFRRRNCDDCKGMLISGINNAPDLQGGIPEKYKTIFLMANRGGLAEPTEICYAITLLAVQYFSAVSADEDTLKKLMCCMNQRNVFLDAMRHVVSSSSVLCRLMEVECKSSHSNFNLIVQSAFNCFAKNHLKRLNSKPMLEEAPKKNFRKIRKLTSKASAKC